VVGFGAFRSADQKVFKYVIVSKLLIGVDLDNYYALISIYSQTLPNIVLKCIGLSKQHGEANDPLLAISVNALRPHTWRNYVPYGRSIGGISAQTLFF
jgi:hypothetical protein